MPHGHLGWRMQGSYSPTVYSHSGYEKIRSAKYGQMPYIEGERSRGDPVQDGRSLPLWVLPGGEDQAEG